MIFCGNSSVFIFLLQLPPVLLSVTPGDYNHLTIFQKALLWKTFKRDQVGSVIALNVGFLAFSIPVALFIDRWVCLFLCRLQLFRVCQEIVLYQMGANMIRPLGYDLSQVCDVINRSRPAVLMLPSQNILEQGEATVLKGKMLQWKVYGHKLFRSREL